MDNAVANDLGNCWQDKNSSPHKSSHSCDEEADITRIFSFLELCPLIYFACFFTTSSEEARKGCEEQKQEDMMNQEKKTYLLKKMFLHSEASL